LIFFRPHREEVLVIRQYRSGYVPLRFVVLGALLVLVPITAIRLQGQATAQQSAPAARVVALRGGTVLTATKGTIANGTVILREGKIAVRLPWVD
jgi:hypothetical protein